MFGYIVVNQQEMKFKEFDEYHRYYCGLCRALKEDQGAKGQLSLSYDMTFLVLLLTGLYEPSEERGTKRCVVHPMTKHEYARNLYSDYAADMNRILTYYKCMDDWTDDKKLFRKLYAELLIPKKELEKEDNRLYDYRQKIDTIADRLAKISELEKENSEDLDRLSGYFGEVLAEIFAVRADAWEENLRKIGYYLGRFVYILDAYDDIEKDRKKHSFNPLIHKLTCSEEMKTENIPVKEWQKLADWVKEVLMMQAAECAREFEKLPIIKNVEILRNIVYSGIWNNYYKATAGRCGDKADNRQNGE